VRRGWSRDSLEVLLREHDEFAQGSRQVLAEQPIVLTQRVLSGVAELAAMARDAGIDHHPVAGRSSRDSVSDRFYNPSTVTTQDVREGEGQPWESAQRPEIEVIECRGLEPDQHLTGFRHSRCRNLGNLEL
jgi:hypothetical protein